MVAGGVFRTADLLEFIVGGEDGAREGTFVLIGFWLFHSYLFLGEQKWFSTTSVIKLFAHSTLLNSKKY